MKLFRPYAAGPHVEVERDWLSPVNAAELAKRVERFWQARGFTVEARVERVGLKKGEFPKLSGGGAFVLGCVRSNLKNGLPPQESAR